MSLTRNIFSLFLFIFTSHCSLFGSSQLILNNDNYQEIINSHSPVLVLFYDNSCLQSKRYENVINEAIRRLKSEQNELIEKVKFAKFDVYKHKLSLDEFDIENIPSLKLFRSNLNITNDVTSAIDINTLSSQSIINYLKKILIKNWQEIKTVEKLKEINQFNSMNLLLCNDDAANREMINSIIPYYDDLFLSYLSFSSNFTLSKYTHCNEGEIVLYKQFDEKEVRLTLHGNKTEIENFLESNTAPLVVEISNADIIQKILHHNVPALIYLYKREPDLESYQLFYNYAKIYRKNKSKVLFLKQNINEENYILPEKLNDKDYKELPTIIGVEMASGDLLKFKLRTKINNDALGNFIEKFLFKKNEFTADDKLTLSEVSEGLNFTDDGKVLYKITSNNFNLIEDCFLLYTYVDEVLPQILDILASTANKLKGVSKVKIGTVNLGLNEINEISDVFALLLYRDSNFIPLKANFSVRKIFDFLIKNSCLKENTLTFTEENEIEIIIENPFEIDYFTNSQFKIIDVMNEVSLINNNGIKNTLINANDKEKEKVIENAAQSSNDGDNKSPSTDYIDSTSIESNKQSDL